MYGKEEGLRTALGTAFVLVSVAAAMLILTASLLTRAGMPFAAAYTVSIIAAMMGTLAVSYGGRTLIALPSPAITAWLVYEEIIAHGLAWQEMLGIAAISSCVGTVLMRTKYAEMLSHALPPIIRTGLVLGLGLGMLMTAALYARILLPSPWALTMGGTLSDPLTYFTLMGILLVLLLCARDVRAALPLGMGVVGLLTWAEGFWGVPAAPFLAPDLIALQTDLFSAAALGLTLLLALVVESTAVLAVQPEAMTRQPLARLFAVGSGAALMGAFPLTIAPISAALPPGETERRIAGIPRTAVFSALLLGFLLPCAPLMQVLTEFPAVPAIALAVMGLFLIAQTLPILKGVPNFTLREGVVIAVFLLSSYDIKTGLTAALFTWTLLTTASGEQTAHRPLKLTAVVVLFFLLKWMI